MKKQAVKLLTMVSLVLVLSAVAANAQSLRRSVNVPFSFTVGQQTLPPGAYTIEPVRRDSRNVWLLQNADSGKSTLFSTNETWSVETATKTKLVFSNYDGQYFLAQIWTAGDNSGREVKRSKYERQVAQNVGKPEQVAITN